MTPTSAEPAPGVLSTLRLTPVSVRYLLGGVLINQMGAFVQTFLVLYLVHRGFSIGHAGVSLGAYSCGAILGTLVGGSLTDRLGARMTIALSMACSGALVMSFPALSQPSRYLLLLGVVAATGAVTQAYRPAAAALLSDLMPARHQVMAFSMLRIAMNIGAAMGPVIAAWLILVNWDLLFWFDGLTALSYSVLAVTLLPRTATSAHNRGGRSPGERYRWRSGYAVVLHDKKFLLYLASMILSAIIYAQFYAVLPLKITTDGHPPSLYSAVLALSSGTLITCELKVTAWVRRWLVSSVAGGIGTALLGLGLAGYGLSSGMTLILVCTVVCVSGLMVSGPTMFAHPSKTPAAVRGRYLGASHAMFGVGLAAGPMLGVLAWDRFGNGIWLMCGIVGVLAAVCAVLGMKEQRDPAPAAASRRVGPSHLPSPSPSSVQ